MADVDGTLAGMLIIKDEMVCVHKFVCQFNVNPTCVHVNCQIADCHFPTLQLTIWVRVKVEFLPQKMVSGQFLPYVKVSDLCEDR